MKNMKNKMSLKTVVAFTGLLVSFSLYAADSVAPVPAADAPAVASPPVGNGLVQMPAVISEGSLTSAVLAVTREGDRIVTVGDRGSFYSLMMVLNFIKPRLCPRVPRSPL